MFRFDHPLYRPLWVRVLLVVLCFGWAVLEAMTASGFWSVLFGVVGVYLFWRLFLRWPREDSAQNSGKDET